MKPTFLSSDEVTSEAIREMDRYWNSLRGAGIIPRKADLWPGDMKQLLPNVMLADIERKPFRVRFRLVGTKVVDATGFDFTGRYLDEIALPHDIGPFLRCYRIAAFTRRPAASRVIWYLKGGDRAEYDLGVWPLSNGGETVDTVIALECYANLEKHAGWYHRTPRRWQL